MENSRKLYVLACTAALTAAVSATLGIAPAPRAAPSLADFQGAERHLDALTGDLDAVNRRLFTMRDQLGTIRGRMRSTGQAIEDLALRILERREAMVGIARELYMGGTAGSMEALLASQSVADLESRVQYLASSGSAAAESFERMLADKQALVAKLNSFDADRARADKLLGQIVLLRQDLEVRVARQEERVGLLSEALAAESMRAAAAAARAARLAVTLEDRATQLVSPPADTGPYSVDWDAIAQCESSGNWSLNSTYDGGLQFHPDTWLGYGGGEFARYAYQATREEQITVAERVLEGQGPSAWPNCFQYG